ncbi:MAG TPA: TetR/AcrR family transcriptional regulator [Myxococcota bacterium]|nr:TetR/AcrR family transcriptional regulator [Myxococcota bacterium]
MNVDTPDTPEPREARRRQILAAAARVFARHGFEATRIHDIAREAGVAYGLVYHYFGSKQDLLDTVIDGSWAAFADAVEGIAASDRAPRDRVRATLDYLFGAWGAHADVVRVVISEVGPRLRSGDLRPEVARALAALTDLFDRAAAEGALRPDLHAPTLAHAFLGAMEGALAAVQTGAATEATLHATLRALFRDAAFLPEPPNPGA